MILAVDPGPRTSGVVVLSEDWPPRVDLAADAAPIGDVARLVRLWVPRYIVCEWVTTYSDHAHVGADFLETARNVGYLERAADESDTPWQRLTRPEVCRVLARNGASKGEVKEAIRDIYRQAGLATGGGADPCRGTKGQPGPLYAVKGHAWDALAAGLAWLRQQQETGRAACPRHGLASYVGGQCEECKNRGEMT